MASIRSPEQEANWQAVRKVVLERDSRLCQDCHEPSSRSELDVHHMIPRSVGGRDEVSNCIVLCDGCHGAKHPNLQLGLSRAMVRRWTVRVAMFVDRSETLPERLKAVDAGLRRFGIVQFRENQLDAVLTALRGESMLVVSPTGSGKSLCYQLPALLKGQPTTIVLAPLKALMGDQFSALQSRKIPASYVNSDIGGREKEQRYEDLESGSFVLFYVAPERFEAGLVRPEEIERISRQRPSFLVVDEAHLIERWGDDFRPAYRQIRAIREKLGSPPILAFTATASPRTQERIKESLGIQGAATIVNEVDRPNIALLRIEEFSDQTRANIVAEQIRQMTDGRALIFVPTKKIGEEVKAAMLAAGCPLEFYHGRLPHNERENLQGRLSGRTSPSVQAIICTSAFAMGIDIEDVRLVVHWLHPSSIEDYFQQFGRAGRDGEPATAVLFTSARKYSGLLDWMARKTSDESAANGQQTAQQVSTALKRRLGEIEAMSDMSRDRAACFRQSLTAEMVGPEPRRSRSLAQRILNWGFGSRTKIKTGDGCCDVCNPELAARLREVQPRNQHSASPHTEPPITPVAPRTAAAAASSLDSAIIELVATADPQLGRTRAVQVLRGGRSKVIATHHYDELEHYGAFRHIHANAVMARVDALLEEGQIVSSGGRFPKIQPAPNDGDP